MTPNNNDVSIMKTIKLKYRNILTLVLIFSASITFAQVGINTTDPETTLDVNGSFSLREGPALTLNNGNNTNIDLGTTKYSKYRIIGPTSDFNILTFLTPNGESAADGQLLTLINTTDHTMTIVHNQGSNANTQRRIYCPGETNLVLSSKNGSVTLQYNESESRWMVNSYADRNYGTNIVSVKATSDTSTNSNSFSDMNGMTITFTPSHSIVYVTFSASGHMDTNPLPAASHATFRLINVTASNRVEAGATTLATDYDYDDMFGEISAVSWNANISMFPVSVTPGVTNTLKVQWLRDGIFPTTLRCNVNSLPDVSHRSLTIFD